MVFLLPWALGPSRSSALGPGNPLPKGHPATNVLMQAVYPSVSLQNQRHPLLPLLLDAQLSQGQPAVLATARIARLILTVLVVSYIYIVSSSIV